jgi:hypothetical protein
MARDMNNIFKWLYNFFYCITRDNFFTNLIVHYWYILCCIYRLIFVLSIYLRWGTTRGEQKKVTENNKETEIKETNTKNIEYSSSEDDSDSTDSEMDTIQNIVSWYPSVVFITILEKNRLLLLGRSLTCVNRWIPRYINRKITKNTKSDCSHYFQKYNWNSWAVYSRMEIFYEKCRRGLNRLLLLGRSLTCVLGLTHSVCILSCTLNGCTTFCIVSLVITSLQTWLSTTRKQK